MDWLSSDPNRPALLLFHHTLAGHLQHEFVEFVAGQFAGGGVARNAARGRIDAVDAQLTDLVGVDRSVQPATIKIGDSQSTKVACVDVTPGFARSAAWKRLVE